MPGDVYLTDYDYGAGLGYGGLSGPDQTQITGGGGNGGGGSSHTSFLIWLIVLVLGSVFILHGLNVAGFTFLFKR